MDSCGRDYREDFESSNDDENPDVPEEDTTLKQSASSKVKGKVYQWKRKTV